ncbi:hypothetical protein GIY56_06110 [Paracoccus sp. YIM 132242]|uniref:Uncharacterized protein n=1 Tax=Paracoccus lichenicola TaxID=2665644 RepID=A0A6L6HL14_9RHOB|nr:hypothetical protein [Paracoccus lichenicola]MTD99853.1 hypothetical protein [Paracoccus lichenicola]
MAKLPAIIELIAKHDTRSVATITNYARVLRDAGVLPKGKRGRGAPEMHQTDVADLILGLAGAGDAVNAPHAVELLRGAKLQPKAELEHDGIVDVHDELAHWSIKDFCEDFGFLLASLLVDEPYRDDVLIDDAGEWIGVTNMTVTIDEVVPDLAFASATVMLDDGNQWVRLSFATPNIEEVSVPDNPSRELIGLNATWARSTRIDYSFFVAASVCINGGHRGGFE